MEQLRQHDSEEAQLQRQFALIVNRAVLEQQLNAIKNNLYAVSSVLQQADGRTVASIQRAMATAKQTIVDAAATEEKKTSMTTCTGH